MMRGIASLCVCFFHLTHNTSFYGNFLPDTDLLKKIGQFGWLGVQMFFVISGFIIPYTLFHNHYHIKNFFRFLSKRWLRIEPPYIASLFLILFVGFFYGWLWHYDYNINWKQLCLHLFYLPQFFGVPWLNEIFWTLALEFQYYLLMAFTFPLFINQKKWIRYFTLIAFASIHFIFQENRLLTSHSSLFLAGIIVFLQKEKLLNTLESILLICLCALYAYFQFSNDSIPISFVLLLSSLMILFLKTNPWWGKFTGKISYSLYLTHGAIGHNVLMFSMYIPFVKDHHFARIMILFLGIAVSMIFAWLFYRFIEKPSQNLSKKISYN
jgi:peptidoglycan/LPS O-acetylase OafA/YrhL